MTNQPKSKLWEWMNSIWLLWVFTLGFFNWVAFIYIGYRTRQMKWGIWGLIYALPFILVIIVDPQTGSTKEDWVWGPLFAMGFISLMHGFRVRKEYLLRLQAIQKLVNNPEYQEMQRREIEREYGLEATQQPPQLQQRSAEIEEHLLDINNASESDIAQLPGVGSILAKKIILKRDHGEGFKSFEEFVDAADLKPHIAVKLQAIVTFKPFQEQKTNLDDDNSGLPRDSSPDEAKTKGRIIDC